MVFFQVAVASCDLVTAGAGEVSGQLPVFADLQSNLPDIVDFVSYAEVVALPHPFERVVVLFGVCECELDVCWVVLCVPGASQAVFSVVRDLAGYAFQCRFGS